MSILKITKFGNTAFSERRWRRQPFDGALLTLGNNSLFLIPRAAFSKF